MDIDNITRIPNISINQNKEKIIQSVSSGREPNHTKIVQVATYHYNKENSHGKKSKKF